MSAQEGNFIHELIKQEPYMETSAGEFLERWCAANDSITPVVVDRVEWDERVEDAGGILVLSGKGKTLFLPSDLHLWEMVGFMELVDNDTYEDAPELAEEPSEKLKAFGRTLMNVGPYIAQRLDAIREGREYALNIAEEFYKYGNKLLDSSYDIERDVTIEEMSARVLSVRETREVDILLAGKSLYDSRVRRVFDSVNGEYRIGEPDIFEPERKRTLGQFFRVMERAILIEGTRELKDPESTREPWRDPTPIHGAFLKKIKSSVTGTVATPRRNFEESFLRRGIDSLLREMPMDTLPEDIRKRLFNWRSRETSLYEGLRIDKLKDELEQIRKTRNLELIVKKEREIAYQIQEAVSSFPYDSELDNPKEMIEYGKLNCVGATLLGGSLMEAAGLRYLVGAAPHHSTLFFLREDDRIEWLDMLSSRSNTLITDDLISEDPRNPSSVISDNIVFFEGRPRQEGLRIYFRSRMSYNPEALRYVTLYEPMQGIGGQLYHNLGVEFAKRNNHATALEFEMRAVELCPSEAFYYYGLGNAYSGEGKEDEAITAYRKSIALDPNFSYSYSQLAQTFSDKSLFDEAIACCKKALIIDPLVFSAHYIMASANEKKGDIEGAVRGYQRYLDKVDPKSEGHSKTIGYARDAINRLQNPQNSITIQDLWPLKRKETE